ncbi:MAG: hypothetical protein ABH851_07270 [Methanobacteriota archaeon]
MEGGIVFVGEREESTGFMLGGLKNIENISLENTEEVFEKLKIFKGLVLMSESALKILEDKKKTLNAKDKVIHTVSIREDDEYSEINNIVKDTIGFNL